MNTVSQAGKLNKASENKKKKSRCANLFKKGAELHSLQSVEVLIVLYDPDKNQFSHYCSADLQEMVQGLLRAQEPTLEHCTPSILHHSPEMTVDAPRKTPKSQNSTITCSLSGLFSPASSNPKPLHTIESPQAPVCFLEKPSKPGVSQSFFDFDACSTKDSSNVDLRQGSAPRCPSPTNRSHYSGSTPELRRAEEDLESEASNSQEDWLDQF